MPIGISEEHSGAAPGGQGLGGPALPAGGAAGARSTRRPRRSRRSGRRSPRRVGSGCTSPRSTAARAPGSPSSWWWPRSSAAPARPDPFLAHALAAAVLQRAVGAGEVARCRVPERAGVGRLRRRGGVDGRARRPSRSTAGVQCRASLDAGAVGAPRRAAGRAGRRRVGRAPRGRVRGRGAAHRRPHPAGRVGHRRRHGAGVAGAARPDRASRSRDLAALLFAAEAVGASQWCVDAERRVREGAAAVRSPDRAVPGREAPLRQHARPHRARARRGVGRRPRRRRRRCRVARGRVRGGARPSTRSSRPRRTACRCTVASGSPGSTTRTCTSGGR